MKGIFVERKLISIIVPVYNVERYLVRCMESILGQTYSNLEIILVDDGSTDHSGQICDEYAKKDSRIRVIHKDNGGLSDARNAGMAEATGEYIGFVDSDDWIEKNMYEELYRFSELYHLDVIAARFCLNIDGVDEKHNVTNEFSQMSGIELLRCNIFDDGEHRVTNSVWDRLYRREILKGIKFPVGRKYEDICFTTKVFLTAEKCGYLDSEIYHYMVRNDSIMGQSKLTNAGFPREIFDDLLPQLREKYDILLKAEQYELAEGTMYNYMYTCQESYADLFLRRGCGIQRKILSHEILRNRRKIKNYCKRRYSKYKELSLYMVFYLPITYAILTLVRKALGRR